MKLRVFGMKTVQVNGFNVYSIRVAVKETKTNEEILSSNGINYFFDRGKLHVIHVTTDSNESMKIAQKIGKALKEIAKANLEFKYSWVYEPEQEYAIGV
jgi:hypothetical protein